MNTKYDTDALYPRFADTPVTDTEEVRSGMMLDVELSGRIAATKVLDTSVHLADGAELTKLTAA